MHINQILFYYLQDVSTSSHFSFQSEFRKRYWYVGNSIIILNSSQQFIHIVKSYEVGNGKKTKILVFPFPNVKFLIILRYIRDKLTPVTFLESPEVWLNSIKYYPQPLWWYSFCYSQTTLYLLQMVSVQFYVKWLDDRWYTKKKVMK